ncbi:outer membrane porin, OprD family [Pseudomonas plecoglossicida]|jgi:imipenem/basic amino acid-specific outer membrane pore|uniref:Outer membrane porin, OprD family n=7 Tax=Pseudomonas TaxID=286 RepID=A0A099N5G7_PSEDL|nr:MULTISPECIES: OprD family porin [Pseudomonas]KXK68431.1 porin [Pseudomonas monteilii]AEJ14552.1 outer membrane porin [Pseudomonas putida S16]AGA74964.1 outer membrane porin [Pseudomonas putida HB3267]AHC84064.1 membrane protein [Pseudomonas monteilii SB3078]AHC89435.1 membrane protein [Pseudomonas monteilii SB3101]
MRVMKWSMIALAVAAGTSQLALASSQDESKGFIEDSKLNVKTRMLYFSRDFRNNPAGTQSRREETGLGFLGTFESGFTQGTVGVGVDAIGMLGLKLDSGKGRAGTGLFPTGSDGRSQDDYSKAGGAVKFRISDTVLKVGDQFTALPVFATDDSRLLPEIAQGTLITSNEIEGLTLHAGHFTSLTAQEQTNRDSFGLKEANVVGGTYAFTDNLSTSLYYSKVEDYWRKYYANVNWALPISDKQGLVFDFNIYDTKSEGSAEYRAFDGDKLDNRAFSLSGAYNIGAHTFTLAYQKVTGDGDYGYGIDGGGTIFLANSVARSDFNAEDEKSWQARYDLNFAEYGIPGLTFMTRYVRGTDANVAGTSNGKEWERDVDIKYVLQSGPAKDLSFRVRQATYRSSDGVYYDSPSIDELRLIVEYPLSIL